MYDALINVLIVCLCDWLVDCLRSVILESALASCLIMVLFTLSARFGLINVGEGEGEGEGGASNGTTLSSSSSSKWARAGIIAAVIVVTASLIAAIKARRRKAAARAKAAKEKKRQPAPQVFRDAIPPEIPEKVALYFTA